MLVGSEKTYDVNSNTKYKYGDFCNSRIVTKFLRTWRQNKSLKLVHFSCKISSRNTRKFDVHIYVCVL